MTSVLQDVRFGARLLISQRRFSAIALLILALGVGTPTVVFSVVNATLLRPLPYEAPDRLVAITSTLRAPGRPNTEDPRVTLTEVEAWRKASRQPGCSPAFSLRETWFVLP